MAISSYNTLSRQPDFDPKTDIRKVNHYQLHPYVLKKVICCTTTCRDAISDLKVMVDSGIAVKFEKAILELDLTGKTAANSTGNAVSTGAQTAINNQPANNQTWTYYIKRGDTLSAIAKRYNTTVEELVRLNHISNPNLIYAGATLLIPLSGVASGNAISTSSQSNNNVNIQPQSTNNTTPSSASSQNVSGETSQISINVPYYNQQDSKWSGTYIGSRTIGDRGCLVTSIAMVESYSSNTTVRPDEMLRKLRFENNSLYWDSAERLGYNYDVCPQKTKGLTANQYQTVYEQLQKGHPVIVGGAINPNDKGNHQHWVVITGYNGDGTSFSPSDFTINDPGRSSRKTLADFFDYKPYPVRMLYKNG